MVDVALVIALSAAGLAILIWIGASCCCGCSHGRPTNTDITVFNETNNGNAVQYR